MTALTILGGAMAIVAFLALIGIIGLVWLQSACPDLFEIEDDPTGRENLP